MKIPMKEIFSIFESLFIQHIGTKTTASQFHEKSAEFYQFAFDCFHKLGEKLQDIELDSPIDCDIASQQTYKDLESLKDLLTTMCKENKDIWLDNLLRGLIDEAEWHCGNARAFVNEEDEWNTDITPKIKPRK